MFTLLRLLIILGSVWGIQHYYSDKIDSAYRAKEEKALPIDQIERAANAKLPMYSENGNARWDSFKLSPYLATYNITLTNITKADIGEVYFNHKTHRKFISVICKMDNVDQFVENDIAFKLSFYDQNGEFIKSLSTEATECRHIAY